MTQEFNSEVKHRFQKVLATVQGHLSYIEQYSAANRVNAVDFFNAKKLADSISKQISSYLVGAVPEKYGLVEEKDSTHVLKTGLQTKSEGGLGLSFPPGTLRYPYPFNVGEKVISLKLPFSVEKFVAFSTSQKYDVGEEILFAQNLTISSTRFLAENIRRLTQKVSTLEKEFKLLSDQFPIIIQTSDTFEEAFTKLNIQDESGTEEHWRKYVRG